MYYIYMLRCMDNSIYTGITNNIEKRMDNHFNGKGAKYTKTHKPLKLEIVWKCKNKSLASKLEYYLKILSKSNKEDIIINKGIGNYLKGKIDLRRYKIIDIKNKYT